METALIAQYPILGVPVIKQIFEWVLSQVSQVIYRNAALVATDLIIDVQVNQEESQVLAAFSNLQMAIASGDERAIAQTSRDLDKAYGAIIHFDGSAPP